MKQNLSRMVVAIFLTGSMAACSSSSSTRGSFPYGGLPANASVEVESSIEDQTIQALRATPLTFVIPYRSDRHAWERAKVFFEKYATPETDAKTAVVTKVIGDKTWVLSNRELTPPDFIYEVKKKESAQGYAYSIDCRAVESDRAPAAELNARNLARFIKDGNLEITLLRK